MENGITIFNNPEFGEIRTTIGDDGEALFCLADVCKSLELDSSAVMRRMDDGVISSHPISDSLGRTQQANFVNEDGLYDAILDSRKPTARKFRKWVTSEVLPSIRKHGAYMTQETIERTLTDPDYLIKLATAMKEERAKRLEAEQRAQIAETKIEEDKPKVIFSDAVVGSKGSCLVGELAKVLAQNGINIGQNRLFEWLRRNGFLGTCGERRNIPMQRYIDNGLFELKKSVHSENDVLVTTTTTKVTQKGCMYFINGFLTGKFQLA